MVKNKVDLPFYKHKVLKHRKSNLIIPKKKHEDVFPLGRACIPSNIKIDMRLYLGLIIVFILESNIKNENAIRKALKITKPCDLKLLNTEYIVT